MKRTSSALALAGILFSTSTLMAAEGWVQNFEDAKKSAVEGKKDLLMDFTGSDWCGWCIRLTEEVFSKEEFQAEAPKHFVLVELDFPQDKKKITPEIAKQNEELQERFKIEGFPTILLADGKGKPYAKTGYQKGGPKAYLSHLEELRQVREKRDGAMAKAEKAEGLERAKLLAEAIKVVDEELRSPHYDDVTAEILKLDTADTLGFKKHQELAKAEQALLAKMDELMTAEKPEEFRKLVDEYISANKLEGEDKQKALFLKLNTYGEADMETVDKLMDEVIALAEKSQLAAQGKQIKAQIAQMREGKKEGGGKPKSPKGEGSGEGGEKQPEKKDE